MFHKLVKILYSVFAVFIPLHCCIDVGFYYFNAFTFDSHNGGRPPSWIWYDVIADHPRLVFDSPNILLKLHVDG